MIAIINYGLSNLLSIERASRRFAEDVVVTSDPIELQKADKLILPGVGSFDKGMEKLGELGFVDRIREEIAAGKPLLGICLGMQMLFDQSEEGSKFAGLGIIPGEVKKIPDITMDGKKQDVPHIGWEKLRIKPAEEGWPDIFEGFQEDREVYFVHSYAGHPLNVENMRASAEYGGRELCAVVQAGKVVGCQFHPEKSGEAGLHLIENFIKNF